MRMTTQVTEKLQNYLSALGIKPKAAGDVTK
jgi:hypothetical protein